MREKKKIIARLLFVIGMAAIITLAGACIYLMKVQEQQKDIINRLAKKEEQLHKKYADQKHQAEEYLWMKTAVEGKERVSQTDLDKVLKEDGALKSEFNAYKEKQTNAINQLTMERDKLQKEFDKLTKTHATSALESQKEQARLSEVNKDLQKKLERSQVEINRCVKANKALMSISKELLIKYKDKGVLSALTAKEPLTQVKKVELEEFVQEYSDKIDKSKFEKQN
ncbi:MAG: hypothetical protein ACLQDF_03450 [Desulfomonilia bacterium]